MSLDCAPLVLVVLILLVILLEFRDRQFRHSWFRSGVRLRRNLGFLAASLIVMPFLPILDEWVRRHTASLFHWQTPGVIETLACFLVAELLGWFLHYIKHRSRFLWSFHFQHHREEQYNIWLAAHTHAVEVVVSAGLIAAVTCLLGFSKPAITIYLLFYSFAKVYQHSAHDYTLGPLDWIVINPRYHRLHHEVNNPCNYGIALTVFDVVFGTARWPAPQPEPPQFGIAPEADLPFNFWEEMVYFLRRKRSSLTTDFTDTPARDTRSTSQR
jgi:sterol desaturase/sphingolipid hydroxylase (fatty acid hydroxylase superfamily)